MEERGHVATAWFDRSFSDISLHGRGVAAAGVAPIRQRHPLPAGIPRERERRLGGEVLVVDVFDACQFDVAHLFTCPLQQPLGVIEIYPAPEAEVD